MSAYRRELLMFTKRIGIDTIHALVELSELL